MLPIMIEVHPKNNDHTNAFNACYIKRLESVMHGQYDDDGNAIEDAPEIERCMIHFESDTQYSNTITVDETVNEVLGKINCAIERVGEHLTIGNV